MAGAKTVDFFRNSYCLDENEKGKNATHFSLLVFLTGVIIYHTQSCII